VDVENGTIVLSLQNFANRSVWYLMCGKCWGLDL
jgi:hypothetical protein